METIKDLLDNLPPPERDRLMYAFEHSLGQHVVLPDGRFIGVNIETIGNLLVEQQAGCWAAGKVQQ